VILQKIVASREEKIRALETPRRSLFKALDREGISLIGEVKRASPSEGVIAPSWNPEELLQSYLGGGIRALSVVTEPHFFQGVPELLTRLKERCPCPVLRKDFLLHPMEIYESYLLGADAVLLIAAILEDDLLKKMLMVAEELGMECLVEVHSSEELARVLDTPARMVGINNRDLRDFSVSLKTTERLVEELHRREPGSPRKIVSESGIRSREDALYLESLGVHGMLVGTALVRSPDPEALARELTGGAGEKAS
jgi:indole-3-glycerol phosphate synthase